MFALEHAISKVKKKKKEGIILDGSHQLLSYAFDVNLLGANITITKKKFCYKPVRRFV
jgi:hypothetical protein